MVVSEMMTFDIKAVTLDLWWSGVCRAIPLAWNSMTLELACRHWKLFYNSFAELIQQACHRVSAYIEVWKQKGSNCYWIKKQIEPCCNLPLKVCQCTNNASKFHTMLYWIWACSYILNPSFYLISLPTRTCIKSNKAQTSYCLWNYRPFCLY